MQRPQEIDKLIITQLKQFGCEIDESIHFLSQLDKHLLYSCSVVCYRALSTLQQKNTEDLPNELPPDMASCYKTCSKLASGIEALGYREKVQFDQFLYPNESTTRKLLSWCVEQLSSLKASEVDEQEEQIGSAKTAMSLQERITASLSALAKSTWTVPHPLSAGIVKSAYAIRQAHEKRRFQSFPINTSIAGQKSSKFEQLYDASFKPAVNQQVFEKHQLAPSIFEDNTRHLLSAQLAEEIWNDEGIESGLNRAEFEEQKAKRVLNMVAQALAASKRSVQQNYSKRIMENVLNKIAQQTSGQMALEERDEEDEEGTFSRRVQYETESQDLAKQVVQEAQNAEEEAQKRIEEVNNLQDYLLEVNKAIVDVKQDMERIRNVIRQTEEELVIERQNKKKSEEKYNIVRTSVKLLADKDNNMKELKRISDMSAAKLIQLATEWETHRKPLIEKIRLTKSQDYQNKTSIKNQYEAYKKNRETMRDIIHDIKTKEDLAARLRNDYEELPKNINRNEYVIQILDIVKNIEKQTQEINKILAQNRELTKEIASISEKLSRTFREVEEMIYKDAQTNESSKLVYKNVLLMRETFEKIISLVQEAGQATNQIRDMEQEIERINSRQDTANMERVANDLKMLKEENQKLAVQIEAR